MERLDSTIRGELAGAKVTIAGRMADVTAAWPAAVGDPISRAAWPQRLSRDGTLHVATRSSVWAYELGRMAPEIQAKLAASLGDQAPSAVRFATGPVPEPAAPPPEDRPERPLAAPEERRAAAELAAAIGDAELRATVARAVAASLARARSNRRF